MKTNNELDLLINNANAVAIDDIEIDGFSEYGNLYQFGEGEYDNHPEWEVGCQVDMEDLIDRIREVESYELFVANLGGHHD
ncbi:hypothetical protein [Gallibacterium anatis]|uniref:hypothetical protein n=1 Tax=Gallibacterium anatis TaxID=750 RepID=UPI0005319D28|nr:hypothetical protein [Gallibacterium anatis]KGQ27265.1 hypothetical protein JP31_04635 [Gallibacterium anatis]KGQ28894.1 hypothetical protein JP27_02575 [Gallibacterium anatis]WIM83058.1 hypothetical protein QP019_05260 [Gallibacterium anatis]